MIRGGSLGKLPGPGGRGAGTLLVSTPVERHCGCLTELVTEREDETGQRPGSMEVPIFREL